MPHQKVQHHDKNRLFFSDKPRFKLLLCRAQLQSAQHSSTQTVVNLTQHPSKA